MAEKKEGPLAQNEKIAARIQAHLKRMERDPSANKTSVYETSNFYGSSACGTRKGVKIKYVAYQNDWNLPAADAVKYLAWLDAGNNGKHFQMTTEQEIPEEKT